MNTKKVIITLSTLIMIAFLTGIIVKQFYHKQVFVTANFYDIPESTSGTTMYDYRHYKDFEEVLGEKQESLNAEEKEDDRKVSSEVVKKSKPGKAKSNIAETEM